MEAWRLLAGLAFMLVVFAVLTTALGYDTTPGEVVVAVLLGGVGLYAGNVLSERLFSDGESGR